MQLHTLFSTVCAAYCIHSRSLSLSLSRSLSLLLQVALDAITAEYVGNPGSALKEQKQILEENLAVIM